jgi:predicted aspartyl protease
MGDVPFVTARSDGQELKLMIDTGRTTTTFFRATWDRLGEAPPDESLVHVGWTISGESTTHGATLKELRLGSIRLLDIPIEVSDMKSWTVNNGPSKALFDGLLGMDVFARNIVVIDGSGRNLYLAEATSGQ